VTRPFLARFSELAVQLEQARCQVGTSILPDVVSTHPLEFLKKKNRKLVDRLRPFPWVDQQHVGTCMWELKTAAVLPTTPFPFSPPLHTPIYTMTSPWQRFLRDFKIEDLLGTRSTEELKVDMLNHIVFLR